MYNVHNNNNFIISIHSNTFNLHKIYSFFCAKVKLKLDKILFQTHTRLHSLTFMAAIAFCFDVNVTKAQPLLWPFWSRSTVHSSILPKLAKSPLTSCSLYFLLSIPTNNLRSAETKNKTKQKWNEREKKNQKANEFNVFSTISKIK